MAQVSRRTLLVGALGISGVAAIGTAEYNRTRLPVGVPRTTQGVRIVNGSFVSKHRNGIRTGWRMAMPAAHVNTPPRVLIALHGRSEDHTSAFDSLYLDHYLSDALQNAATSPYSIASVDGGDHSYWHPRQDGDTAGMVLDEFLPILESEGIDISRVGFLGWSMGGYGALYLAGRLGASRTAVAIAESPAIWHDAGQSASGAFDDADDFDAHSIFGHLDLLRGIALRIDCGSSDGFAPVARDLRAALSPSPAGGIEPGGHDASYWRSQAAAQLHFAGQHLAA